MKAPGQGNGGGRQADSQTVPQADRAITEAKAEGVSFVAGPDFMIEGGRNSLRLSFAPVPADQMAEGVGRIAAALERMRSISPA